MKLEDMQKVIKALKEKDNFLITAHVNPEGDSIGSQIALKSILEGMGKKAVMAGHDSVPENLKFLKGQEMFLSEVPEDFKIGAAIVLDCPVKERAGRISKSFKADTFIINIDHHVSNEFFGDVNWVEEKASSVGEMIFLLTEEMHSSISKETAEAIYTAIVTDTGMFNYDNTSQDTHDIAGKLISLGVNPKSIHREVYERKSLPEIRLLGRALGTLQVSDSGAIAYMHLTRSMYEAEGAGYIATDEFINFPRSVKTAKVAVFFKENYEDPEKINVNFRSSGEVNVNAVASRFGGGGHEQAAGCVLEAGMEEAKEKVLSEIRKSLLKR